MILTNLVHNAYMNESSFQERLHTRFSNVSSHSYKPMLHIAGMFYKHYPTATTDHEHYDR
jgi:hypothetical protein